MNPIQKFLNKMERKFGRYAIHNLPFYIVMLYAIGFVLQLVSPNMAAMCYLNPDAVLHGQVWRLVTFLIVPPSDNLIFILFVLLFYYSICQSLERVWGSFRFNVYFFTGVIGTILGSFILYAITKNPYIFMGTYYLNMSLFLAFAASFPDMVVYFMMILPIKVKWLGVLDAIYLLIAFIQGDMGTRISIVVAMLNFILFFAGTKNYKKISPKEIRRKQTYRREVDHASTKAGQPRHRCAVCGRTEFDDPNLEFRYCSKCDGDYEYCQDHLFTHTHIKK